MTVGASPGVYATRLVAERIAPRSASRLSSLFLPGPDGKRPCHGEESRYAKDPHFKELVLFHEYFHGEAPATRLAGLRSSRVVSSHWPKVARRRSGQRERRTSRARSSAGASR